MGTTMIQGQLNNDNQPSESSSIRIRKVLACTSQESTAAQLRSKLASFANILEVTSGANAETVSKADVIILACKPYMAADILQEDGMKEACWGKLVISLLAGTTTAKLRSLLFGEGAEGEEGTRLIRVIPTVGATVGESMTLIERPTNKKELQPTDLEIVNDIFAPLGPCYFMTASTIETATALQAASIALSSMLIDGLVDGAVAEGLKRKEAQTLAIQGLLSVAKLLSSGSISDPAMLREMVSSPRGVSIQAILSAEKSALRYTGAAAVVAGAEHLSRISSPSSSKQK